MRMQIGESGIVVWLSPRDTYEWAHKPGAHWPCSTLSNRRVMAGFDSNGLCEFTINGRDGDCDSHEFNAILADLCGSRVPKDHPLAWIFEQGR